jgi:hypothetical protein
MRKTTLICGFAACAAVGALSAREFPLTFKPLTCPEAMNLPGGYGATATLQTTKPSALKREPAASAGRALYGELGRVRDSGGILFRLEAAPGGAQGYDRLRLDLNQNGDLTDDPFVRLADKPQITRAGSSLRETAWFGPVEAPPATRIAPGRPSYYLQLNYYGSQATPGVVRLQSYLGTLRLRPGFYLETTVELGGLRQKVGVVDGNANFRLGDAAQPVTNRSDTGATWYFPPGDSFLVDRNGSGKFETDRADSESSPFGPVLVLGLVPCRAKLAPDCAALDIEPWPGGSADLAIQPSKAQVRDLALAWERSANDWVLLKTRVSQGHAKVPPGNLRFNGCVLEARTRDGSPLVLVGTYRKVDKGLGVAAGQTAALTCGAPLELQLTAEKRRATLMPEPSLLSRAARAPADAVVEIQAEVVGQAGETYGTFLAGKALNAQPPPPRFTVSARDGREVAAGNLEYG